MTRKSIILLVVGIVAGAAAVFLIVTIFKPSQKQDDKYLNMVLAMKDQQIKEQQDLRKELIEHYNQDLAESHYRDSLLVIKSKTNTIRYEKVPATVNALSQPELVSAIESEFGQ